MQIPNSLSFNSMPLCNLDTAHSEKFMLRSPIWLIGHLIASFLLLLLAVAPTLASDSRKLQTQCQKGDLSRVTVSLDVQGSLTIAAAGKRQNLPIKVEGG